MSLSDAEKNSLRPLRQTFEAGKVLFSEGDRSDETYILLSGEIEIRKGGKKIVAITSEGSFFGEMATLLNETRTAEAVAVKQSQCIVMSKINLEKTICNTPAIALKLLKTVATRLSVTTGELVKSARKVEELESELQKRGPDFSEKAQQFIGKKQVSQKSDEKTGDDLSVTEMHNRYPFEERLEIFRKLATDEILKSKGKQFGSVERALARLNKDLSYLEPPAATTRGRDDLSKLAARYKIEEEFDLKVSESYRLMMIHMS